jgi:hypothetical protein
MLWIWTFAREGSGTPADLLEDLEDLVVVHQELQLLEEEKLREIPLLQEMKPVFYRRAPL